MTQHAELERVVWPARSDAVAVIDGRGHVVGLVRSEDVMLVAQNALAHLAAAR